MVIKKLLGLVVGAGIIYGAQAQAVTLSVNFELIGSVGALSEYSMRGIFYTQRKPAV